MSDQLNTNLGTILQDHLNNQENNSDQLNTNLGTILQDRLNNREYNSVRQFSRDDVINIAGEILQEYQKDLFRKDLENNELKRKLESAESWTGFFKQIAMGAAALVAVMSVISVVEDYHITHDY